jgi:tRNA A-37 threonylcarbamoyl transferase component Bud32
VIGRRLGPYEIIARLGAGGMGEVFRARDPKLNREVAIKALPEAMANDAERLARFEREAQVLASLNHPHVAAIYGLEEADGKPFLVLELVEGEDLAERLKRGPIPVEEALAVARQIAEALEEAHEKGIVHRDLKPANVKLTPDGKIKVLDFGLAKAYTGEAASGSSADVSQSPTLAHKGTQAGLILGTAAYMSPEQARGKPVDKRSDIWAFGVVLYEMLSGARLFEGETVSDVLAGVLKTEIDFGRLPESIPAPIRGLLRRCLQRRPEDRLRDIGDARLAIAECQAGTLDEAVSRAAEVPARRLPAAKRWFPIVAAAAALCGLLGRAVVAGLGRGRAAEDHRRRWSARAVLVFGQPRDRLRAGARALAHRHRGRSGEARLRDPRRDLRRRHLGGGRNGHIRPRDRGLDRQPAAVPRRRRQRAPSARAGEPGPAFQAPARTASGSRHSLRPR